MSFGKGNHVRCALVTGASGFIGRNLCQYLQHRGIRVIAVMRSKARGPWDDVIQCDLESSEIALDCVSEVDTIFHLAGRVHQLYEQGGEQEHECGNVETTERLLNLAKTAQIHRFVFFSSLSVMGDCTSHDQSFSEVDTCDPQSAYGRSKLDAEYLLLESDLKHVSILRPAMVYGFGCKGNLPRMIQAVNTGWFPPLPKINNQRSMVHVDDVVQAAIMAAEKHEAAGQTYIVTDGTPYSTRQIYEWICEALHKPVPDWYVPMSILKMLAGVGDGIGTLRRRRFMFDSDALDKLMGSACYSSAKVERELGFCPQRTLRESLPEMIEYLHRKHDA